MKLYPILIVSYYSFNIREHLSTKSPYPQLNSTANENLNNCKIKQLLHVNRHGTRFPSFKDIEKFKKLNEKIKTIDLNKLKDEDRVGFQWVKAHNFNFILEDNELLAEQGQLELYNLGQRMSDLHPTLFKSLNYKPYLFPFSSSIQSRSAMSGSAYSMGLFEYSGNLTKSNLVPVFIETFPKSEDPYLEIKKSCRKWLVDIDGGKASKTQTDNFVKVNYPKHVETLNSKFNIKLNLEEFKSIYKYCGYELSIFGNENNWCKFLNQEMVQDLEFENDLDDYYTYSYGSEINEFMGTKLISKLFNYTKLIYEEPKSNEPAPNGVFMFGHSETIQFLITTLGLFKDEAALKWDMSKLERNERKYRTSKIAPFASNVDFEIYNCNKQQQSEVSGNRQTHFNGNKLEDLYIQIKLNEKLVSNPSCNKNLCSLSEFLNYYKSKLEANFEKLCEL